jgi:myo-inositol-1(or 4)-monophosphatase
MARSALLNVMASAAMKAGRTIIRDFGELENLQVTSKGLNDFVTKSDRKSEEILFEQLERARPGYDFLMEERGVIDGSGNHEHRWIIDPLDGTTNFMHGIPLFGVSIALESKGVLTAGVVYNPISDELFAAERGKGAYLNERRLRVSGRKSLTSAMITTGIPHLGAG